MKGFTLNQIQPSRDHHATHIPFNSTHLPLSSPLGRCYSLFWRGNVFHQSLEKKVCYYWRSVVIFGSDSTIREKGIAVGEDRSLLYFSVSENGAKGMKQFLIVKHNESEAQDYDGSSDIFSIIFGIVTYHLEYKLMTNYYGSSGN